MREPGAASGLPEAPAETDPDPAAGPLPGAALAQGPNNGSGLGFCGGCAQAAPKTC